MYLLRFDMRAPDDGPAAIGDLYKAAVEMAEWGESNGCITAMISEHHCSPDNYIPSPIALASAMAARTQNLPLNIAALLLNFYDPIKLAEDMAVLDIISGGRTSYVMGLGYRAEEYDMFGVPMKERGAIIEDKITALLKALSGDEFEYQGRKVTVRPRPISEKISIAYGGHSKAAARRAGKFGMDFFANGGDESLLPVYEQACTDAGFPVGNAAIPPLNAPQCVFVAEDLDQAWEQIGPYMLHDIRMYREWEGEDRTAVTSFATTIEEVREQNGPYRIFTPEQALEIIRAGAPLMMHPLVGGCPPELGWASLKLVAEKVLPAL